MDEFLRRDDNSYTLPDKKYYRKDVGISIVALVDCMRNLHRKFVVEKDLALSFATFCKARDKRTVKTSVFLKWSVCLCKPHANMGLMLEAVPALPNRTSELLLLSDENIMAALDAITAEVVQFKRWDKERWYPPEGPNRRRYTLYRTIKDSLSLILTEKLIEDSVYADLITAITKNVMANSTLSPVIKRENIA